MTLHTNANIASEPSDGRLLIPPSSPEQPDLAKQLSEALKPRKPLVSGGKEPLPEVLRISLQQFEAANALARLNFCSPLPAEEQEEAVLPPLPPALRKDLQ